MSNLFVTSNIIGDALGNTLDRIGLFIDSIVYWFISTLYQVFVAISRANLFTESTLRTITDRVFTILGVIMLFIMAYEIIMMIISPDKLSGENGAKRLVSKLVTSIVLIVLLPTAYKYMQIFQDDVITSNVIGNVVLGSKSSTSADYDLKSAGTSLALSIGQAFYHPMYQENSLSYQDCKKEEYASLNICVAYVKNYENALEKNSLMGFFLNPELSDLQRHSFFEIGDKITYKDSRMNYIPILSTIAAFFALKAILAFCIDIGVRVAKLGFLQVIAPIPIAMNITKKESIFQSKWFKSLTETYLDIFMKLIVISFSMFAVTLVPDIMRNLWFSDKSGAGGIVQLLATVAVILGILQFAKDAPKLIKDLFNMDLDFSIKKRLNDNTYAMRGVSTIGSAGASFASNVWDGMDKGKGFVNTTLSGLGGLAGGGRRGWKNSDGIDNWKKTGGVINKSRSESDTRRSDNDYQRALGNDIGWGDENRRVVPGLSRVVGILGPGGVLQDMPGAAKKKAVEWLDSVVDPEKLKATKEVESMFSQFMDTIGGAMVDSIKEAEKTALKDFNGRKPVYGITVTDKHGVQHDSGSEEGKKLLTTKDIKAHFKAMKKDEYANQMANNDALKASAKQYGDVLADKIEDALKQLGPEARKNVFGADKAFASIEDLRKVFETGNYSADIFGKLLDVKSAIGDQTTAQSLQQKTEEAKSGN